MQLMISNDHVFKALKSIVEQKTNTDIVSAGYIVDVDIKSSSSVSVTIQIPSESIGLKPQYESLIKSALKSLSGITEVDVISIEKKDPTEESMKRIKHIIAISSCKGGVGKSTTAVNIAFSLKQKGFNVGIFDADIYGPSLPTMVQANTEDLFLNNGLIEPPTCKGVKLMSFGFTQEHDSEKTAAMLRGPMVSQIITQLLKGTNWGELDYLIIDYPPGTGDIQLTLGQLIPIDAAIIITTPQYISFIDVIKGIEMFDQLNIPTVGIVENMSYFQCDNCDKKHYIFGKSLIPRFINEYGISNSFQFPTTPSLAEQCDLGTPFVEKYPKHILSDQYRKLADCILDEIQAFKAQGYRSPTIDYNEKAGIILTYQDKPFYFDPKTLRNTCRCAHCVDEFTGEKKNIVDIETIFPVSINLVGNYAVGISWSDNHSSLFPLNRLIHETQLQK